MRNFFLIEQRQCTCHAELAEALSTSPFGKLRATVLPGILEIVKIIVQ